MASTSSPPLTALPWFWVIETLADCEQADVSLLRDLIARVPDFATDAATGARERVALRCLEESVASAGTGGTSRLDTERPSTSGSGVRIDVGRSSEEVLIDHARKLRHTSKCRANVSTDGLHQFILQKRAGLAKSSLDLLKESILEGRFQSLSSLKGHSGLSQQQCNNNAEVQSSKHVSTVPTPDSGSAILHENPSPCRHHLPKLSVTDGTRIGHLHKDVNIGCSNVQLSKQSSMPEPSRKENIIRNDDKIQSIEQTAAASGPFSSNMVLQADPSGLGQHLTDPNVSDGNSGRHNLCQDVVSTAIDDAKLLRHTSMAQAACNDVTNFPVATLNGSGKNMNPALCENDQIQNQPNVLPESETDGGGSSDIPSDIDPDGDMLANEKHRLLGSPVHVNIDCLPEDLPEECLCRKCGKGGQMLNCSESGCLIAVHKSCMGPSVNFEKTGPFYCPNCVYNRALIAFREAKENVVQAKKALSAFLGEDVVQGQKQHSPAKHRREKSQATGFGALSQQLDVQSNQYQHNRVDENSLKEKEQQQQTEIAGICKEGKFSCGRSEKQPRLGGCDVPQNVMFVNNREHIRVGEQQQQSECHAEADCGDLPHEERDICNTIFVSEVSRTQQKGSIHLLNDHGNIEQQTNGDTDQKTPSSRTSERHCKRVREDAAVSETRHPQRAAGNQNRDESSRRNNRKHLQQPQRYSNPVGQLGRRKKLAWTMEEEEALKEAVAKFSAKNNGNLPWRKMLEFGQHIFHRTRQPGDLKDKWRNIKIKEGIKN